MELFISWSGEQSESIAEALKNWLPSVLQALEPWLSSADIDAGSRWHQELDNRLSSINFGIICITPDNQNAKWLQYEAGALSKAVDQSRVVPYVYGLQKVDIEGPLSHFQSVEADKEGTLKLVQSLNKALGHNIKRPISDDQLLSIFNKWWPDLEEVLKSVPESNLSAKEVRRDTPEMIREVVENTRSIARRFEKLIEQVELNNSQSSRKNKLDENDANLALANVYERLSRSEFKTGKLEESDQAIKRVLENSEATKRQRAEALSLKARNQKTRWRRELKKHDIDHNRKHALSRQLMTSYEAYYEAFLYDLNHFYPGLNALQMARILLDLSTDTEGWGDMFDSDEEANRAKKELTKRVEALEALVPLSVEAALKLMPNNDPDRMWAEISAADLLFLTSTRLSRISGAYKNAIPRNQAFGWDAARGQLELFADLGVKEELAREVIKNIDEHFAVV